MRVKLFNRNKHNVTIAYDGESVVIPPRGEVTIENDQLLGSLPSFVAKIPVD